MRFKYSARLYCVEEELLYEDGIEDLQLCHFQWAVKKAWKYLHVQVKLS